LRRKINRTVSCRYCRREIGRQGWDSHLHFKHRLEIIEEFRNEPFIKTVLWIEENLRIPGERIAKGLLLHA
jgi:hypothetical protein